MNAIQRWSNLAIDRARERNIDVTPFQSKDHLIYWWLGTYSKKFTDDYVYFELRCCSGCDAWVVFGAVFSKWVGSVSIGVEPFATKLRNEKNQPTQHVVFDALSPGYWNNFNCVLEIYTDPLAKTYEMKNIRVTVSRGPSWKNTYPVGQPIGEIHEDFSSAGEDAMAGVYVEVPCPDCQGTGFNKTFAIPKEDRASGLTGYDLYSCNKINSTVACVTCGGEGVKYEEWYSKEQPELATDSKIFRNGVGLVQVQRLPRIGTIKDCGC